MRRPGSCSVPAASQSAARWKFWSTKPGGDGRSAGRMRGTLGTDLPPAYDPTLVSRAAAARQALDDELVILGHHYQKPEVIQFADARGDRKSTRLNSSHMSISYAVFCLKK